MIYYIYVYYYFSGWFDESIFQLRSEMVYIIHLSMGLVSNASTIVLFRPCPQGKH